MLIEAATARSEHDPDLEASVAAINLEAAAAAANLEAAAAAHLEAAAADITMHPVTGAFADSSHESAFRVGLTSSSGRFHPTSSSWFWLIPFLSGWRSSPRVSCASCGS